MTEYFPHDFNASNDHKMMALIFEYKATGYGLYWIIIEMLHSEKSHTLPLNGYVFQAIANKVNTSPEIVKNFIHDCIYKFVDVHGQGLFFLAADNIIASRRVNINVDIRNEISNKRSASAKLSHLNRTYTKEPKLSHNQRETVIEKNDYDNLLQNNGSVDNQLNTAKNAQTQSNLIPDAEQNPAIAMQNLANVEQNPAIAEQNPAKENKGNKKTKEIIKYKQIEYLCLNMNISLQNAIKEHIDNRVLKSKPFTFQGFERFLSRLLELSGGDEEMAIKIIQQSVDNRWNEIYQLNQNNHGNISNAKAIRNSKGISKEFIERNEAILRGEYR